MVQNTAPPNAIAHQDGTGLRVLHKHFTARRASRVFSLPEVHYASHCCVWVIDARQTPTKFGGYNLEIAKEKLDHDE